MATMFKPLPTPLKDDKLPLPPPHGTSDASGLSNHNDVDSERPPPPPKLIPPTPGSTGEEDDDRAMNATRPPPIETHLTPGPSRLPKTPTTPMTPISPSTPLKKATNPLIDLNETEKLYVDQLTGVIRKVAGAWSRSNLPPPHLDTMFRSIESIYKANRSFYNKLKEVGTNPSSPKALGDLLMRWVDDLDGPYTFYCNNFRSGFDVWDPVASNAKLPGILAAFSASVPPPSSPNSPSASSAGSSVIWALDDLFRLPAARLKYYRKLYNRLLKGTQAGRSDHKLLVGALEKLDRLMSVFESREGLKAGDPDSPSDPPAAEGTSGAPPVDVGEDEVVIDMRQISNGGRREEQNEESAERGRNDERSAVSSPNASGGPGPGSEDDVGTSGSSIGERSSRETANTSLSRSSVDTMSMPVSDLEKRLSTHRTIDLFTMKPKVVKLQISPPQLTYTREMRFSSDVIVRFTPRATGVEIVHRAGHIFLLSDLFLICERMSPEERNAEGGADMSLCYPPLAGKVLRVAEVPDQDNVISVAIMRKETMFLQVDSVHARDYMLKEFKECIDFASTVGPVSKQPPPPMPSLPGNLRGGPPGPQSPPDHARPPRIPTPEHLRQSRPPSSTPSSRPPSSSASQPSSRTPSLSQQPSTFNPRGVISPPPRMSSSGYDGNPGQPLPRSMSAGPVEIMRQPSIGPGQVMRNPSIGPGQVMPPPPPPHGRGMPIGMGGPPPPGPPGPNGRRASVSNAYPPGPGPFPPGAQYRGPPPGHPGGPPFNPHLPPPPPMNALQPGAGKAPSDPSFQGGLRKSPSMHSLHQESGYSQYPPHMHPSHSAPPLPGGRPGYGQTGGPFPPHMQQGLHAPQPRPLLPSAHFNVRGVSMAGPSFEEPSPPNSPVEETRPPPTGPVTSSISAQMKCKVFLKQQHAQWKSLGSAKLKLYREDPTNIKQLVVEADSSKNTVLISTIVLTDGVERVGKTGIAIELSDKGQRTGIVYMIQLRNEKSAGGLFDSLLVGSDRGVGK